MCFVFSSFRAPALYDLTYYAREQIVYFHIICLTALQCSRRLSRSVLSLLFAAWQRVHNCSADKVSVSTGLPS